MRMRAVTVCSSGIFRRRHSIYKYKAAGIYGFELLSNGDTDEMLEGVRLVIDEFMLLDCLVGCPLKG